MPTVLEIGRRELFRMFATPFGWVLLAVVELLLGYAFLSQLDRYLSLQGQLAALPNAPGVTKWVVAQWYGSATIILLLVMPLVTMRLIAEERRNETFILLLSAPVSNLQIILGKYLAALGIIAIMLGTMLLMPLSLVLGGTLDWGLLLSANLGLALLLASFAAVGLYMSVLARQPATAAAATFGVLLLLWIIQVNTQGSGEATQSAFAYLSLVAHYQTFVSGVLSTEDAAYFLLLSALCITLSVRRLAAQRRFG